MLRSEAVSIPVPGTLIITERTAHRYPGREWDAHTFYFYASPENHFRSTPMVIASSFYDATFFVVARMTALASGFSWPTTPASGDRLGEPGDEFINRSMGGMPANAIHNQSWVVTLLCLAVTSTPAQRARDCGNVIAPGTTVMLPWSWFNMASYQYTLIEVP